MNSKQVLIWPQSIRKHKTRHLKKKIYKGWTFQRENTRWTGTEINRFTNTFSPYPLCPGSRYSSYGFFSAWEQDNYESGSKVHAVLSKSSGNASFLFSNLRSSWVFLPSRGSLGCRIHTPPVCAFTQHAGRCVPSASASQPLSVFKELFPAQGILLF